MTDYIAPCVTLADGRRERQESRCCDEENSCQDAL
jgi:hypothetical protein